MSTPSPPLPPERPSPPTESFVEPGAADDWLRLDSLAMRPISSTVAPGGPRITPASEHDQLTLASAPVAASPPPIPPRVGRYEIVAELGRGGMGVVYEARDPELHRPVAVKMLLGGFAASPETRQRFHIEAEAAARLHHPNIVQIYEIGEHEGQPFLALEFVSGQTLSRYINGDPQRANDAATLVQHLAHAVHYAHQNGIIHRDLKPGNVLLTMEDCRLKIDQSGWAAIQKSAVFNLQSAIPKIADFGLAKLDAGDPGAPGSAMTRTGEILGTPAYMAPEQIEQAAGNIGPATDVYALGAILYELLTVQAPFRAMTPFEVMAQVLARDPVPPGRLQPGIPADLATICLKCLEKSASRRYPSAAALADDLGRFLNHEPIRARPVSRLERLRKWVRRRPAVAALSAGLAVAMLLGLTAVVWQWREAVAGRSAAIAARTDAELARDRAQQEEAIAKTEKDRAEKERHRAERHLYFSHIAQADLQYQLGNIRGAEQLLDQCDSELRGWEWRYLKGRNHADLYSAPLNFWCNGLTFSPNGELLAVSARLPGLGIGDATKNGELIVLKALTGEVVATLLDPRHDPGLVWSFAFDPDGRRLAVVRHDGTLQMWDVATEKPVLEFAESRGTGHRIVRFSRDGKTVSLARTDGTLRQTWDTATGQEIAPAPVEDKSASGNELIRAETPLAAARLQGAATGKLMQALGGPLADAVLSPDGRHLATAGADGTVRLWDAESGAELLTLRGHAGRVAHLAFHPSGRFLASGGEQPGEVKFWDLSRAGEQLVLANPLVDRAVLWTEALGFDAEGRTVRLISENGILSDYSATTGRILRSEKVPYASRSLTPSARAVLSGDAQRSVWVAGDPAGGILMRVWDTGRAQSVRTFTGLRETIWGSALSQDGSRAAMGLGGPIANEANVSRGEFAVWDVSSGSRLLHGDCADAVVSAVALSRDGRWLAVAGVRQAVRGAQKGPDFAVNLWPVPGVGERGPERPRWELRGLQAPATALAFDPANRYLAASDFAGKVRVWDLATGEMLAGDRGVSDMICPGLIGQLAFHPTEERLAAVNRDLVKIWDLRSGEVALTRRGAPPRTSDYAYNPRLAWSPNGQRLIASIHNRTLSIWDAAERDKPEDKARMQIAAESRAFGWHLRGLERGLAADDPPLIAFHQRWLIGLEPASAQERVERGEVRARMSHWAEAADDFRQAFGDSTTTEFETASCHACLCLLSGDGNGYRRCCAEWDKQAAAIDDVGVRRMAVHIGALAKRDGADTDSAVATVRKVVALFPGVGWLRCTLALAQYRAGQCADAVQTCEECMRQERDPHLDAIVHLTRALAEDALGHRAEASAERERADKWLRDITKGRRDPSICPPSISTSQWLLWHVLRREAG